MYKYLKWINCVFNFAVIELIASERETNDKIMQFEKTSNYLYIFGFFRIWYDIFFMKHLRRNLVIINKE